ncbi:MAG: endonuclease/exonuclease/phosphatase family protein [Candidatus Neomarinimicrobiota bacterium]|jgi:endonuclease/exonuclease/phosphatase family metal-dependent hydrolase|nr:endonuclease/exonuclease/phosphatase family protein [Candidatus Neomarinimicrobiota bacterium]MDD3966899.1 endonuclease/exonuclease/phosphatase family protein [Candidatus Neomarinimicrobiota bacterium]MDX9780838.1 endonuclease/exonuclease/phosphatase family protein [bacterium]
MKRIFYLLIVLLVLCSCNKITVMSYNIHAMRGMDKEFNAERIADVILAEKPDLVGLQEVDHLTARSGNFDAVTFFEEYTGMHVIYMKTFDYQGGAFGNMVLSRFPVLSKKEIRLPSREAYEPRLLMRVSVLTDKGDTLHFYNTHLDHHGENSDRPDQMRKIAEVLSADSGKRILLGDMNCEPGSEPLNMLNGLMKRCLSNEKTYPADLPERIIDHVYFASGEGLRCSGLKVIPEKIASDHRPVVAHFRLR